MSTAGRWSDIVAKIEAEGGPITPHPDAETARRLAENTPRLPPVTAYNVTRLEPALDTGEELPAPIAAQPYPAEVTPEPETVQNPAENESPVEDQEPDLPDIIARLLTGGDTATLDAEWDRIREGALSKVADIRPTAPLPNPPSRRGWRRLFRRTA
ncbi:hypothetical protein [Amycolatopsis sp. CFH S0078]|uniref:hypothetical protein n=1 Tax=Amycolatopsis sp. CFH S0078 TaxID=1644108 RepID=UPI00106E0571|nr:hypothetical protein [Amycolatopsis sp. CFH S0078]